jgi:hypothetical protein
MYLPAFLHAVGDGAPATFLPLYLVQRIACFAYAEESTRPSPA